ncbi:nicotinamide N-methyltransferase-like [Pelodytes ibericus]
MDSSLRKLYHVHGFDPQHLTDTYFSPKADKDLREEAVIDSMKYIHKEAISGHVKGDLLIDISFGPGISHLFSIFDQFKEITILEFNDRSVKYLERWINKHEDATDWTHVSEILMELHGKCDVWQEKEEALRRKIKLVLKCDFDKENLMDRITLPKADCIITTWILDCVSKDHAAYCRNLRKISSLLKPGGHLILFGDINVTYYMIGQEKFHILTYDEEFLRSSLKDARFKIERYEAIDRKTNSGIIDHDKVVRITAVKEVESYY